VNLLQQFRPDTIAVTVDGKEVADVWSSDGTSSELTVTLPAGNFLGTAAGTTPFVASEWAVLVHPLPPGTHAMQVCLTGAAVGALTDAPTPRFASCRVATERSLHHRGWSAAAGLPTGPFRMGRTLAIRSYTDWLYYQLLAPAGRVRRTAATERPAR
jgi:hypothetical protein